LHGEGQTILLTTHYMEEADELCSRLAIIDRGRLLALGPPAELKRSTGADTVVTVSATGDLDRAGEGAGNRRARCDPGHARRLHRRRRGAGPDRRAPVGLQRGERHGFEVSDLSITEPTLETVFINLTGKDLRE